jgi:hypothetical protein
MSLGWVNTDVSFALSEWDFRSYRQTRSRSRSRSMRSMLDGLVFHHGQSKSCDERVSMTVTVYAFHHSMCGGLIFRSRSRTHGHKHSVELTIWSRRSRSHLLDHRMVTVTLRPWSRSHLLNSHGHTHSVEVTLISPWIRSQSPHGNTYHTFETHTHCAKLLGSCAFYFLLQPQPCIHTRVYYTQERRLCRRKYWERSPLPCSECTAHVRRIVTQTMHLAVAGAPAWVALWYCKVMWFSKVCIHVYFMYMWIFCAYLSMYTCAFTWMYLYEFISMNMYTYMYVCIYAYIYIYIYI